MINGTGPGRGTPWWRWRRVLTLRWAPGAEVSWAPVALGAPEPVGGKREGRTVAVIGR
jgi:hypothetical protein